MGVGNNSKTVWKHNLLAVFCLASLMLTALDVQSKGAVINLDGTMYIIAVPEPTTSIPTVTSAGQVWMDRNLGATQVAISSIDELAYGDLYQWGRLSDGHQNRTGGTITTMNSDSDVPGHDKFITEDQFPFDWREPQNDNLWQDLVGGNNPCPQGFRLPTKAEFETERLSWSSNDADGAFASPLKLVVAGTYSYLDGTLNSVGTHGQYWTSTITGFQAYYLQFRSDHAYEYDNFRASGLSVRCIKE